MFCYSLVKLFEAISIPILAHLSLLFVLYFPQSKKRTRIETMYVLLCNIFQLFSFLEKISCLIVSGGRTRTEHFTSNVEVIFGDLGTKQLPNLPKEIIGSSMVLHDGALLLCGGRNNWQKCLQLNHGIWTEHSTLNEERFRHSAVTTQTATFIFGGVDSDSSETYEYLPKGSTTWLMGKTEIPGYGFMGGCAIAVKSDQEIWLIGGYRTEKRILSFNVNDHTFKQLTFQLNVERSGHRCAFIPNTKKVMITCSVGDDYDFYDDYDDDDYDDDDDDDDDVYPGLNSTLILDIEDGSVTIASPMNCKRALHGMGVLTIKGEDRLAVFGGFDGRNWLDSVETYNSHTAG